RAADGRQRRRDLQDGLPGLVPRPRGAHPREGARRRQRRPHGTVLLPGERHERRREARAVQPARDARHAERLRLDLPECRQPLDAEADAEWEGLRGRDLDGRPALGGFGETGVMPPPHPARPAAASSVASIALLSALPASLPQTEQRTPSTNDVPPNPPRNRLGGAVPGASGGASATWRRPSASRAAAPGRAPGASARRRP